MPPSLAPMDEDDSCSRSGKKPKLIDVRDVDAMFPAATCAATCLWIFLLLLVYSLVPSEQLVYLDGQAREAAAAACYVFLVSTGLSLSPVFIRGDKREKVAGIYWAGIAVQVIACLSNALLAWAPTVVVTDPVTHSHVYLVRWAEWVPLAGLMTFFSEIVDCQEGLHGVLIPVLISLGQSLSCVMGMIFPFCPTKLSWMVCMALSFVLYLSIFPRVAYKRTTYKNTREGLTLAEMEHSCRIKFAYELLLTCTFTWTGLVGLYFLNMMAFAFYPDSVLVQNQALPMILDTLFDVCAKALYMKTIVNVHETVFDADGRTSRQLSELKRMIGVLWKSSSDVIVISVRQGANITTMISPTFPNMIGISVACGGSADDAALMVKSEELQVANNQDSSLESPFRIKSSAYFVNSSDIPYGTSSKRSGVFLPSEQVDELVNSQAELLVRAAWEGTKNDAVHTTKKEFVVVRNLEKMDGSVVKSEIKVARHSDNAVIAVVRDVTERYLRFDAERRVHTEAMARQKEAHAVNRFTRHEVKNGLLSGIEMCSQLSRRVLMSQADASESTKHSDKQSPWQGLSELDRTLHEVLDTVLIEAMARDIVHESYQPKLERVDIHEALASGAGMHDEKIVQERFPLHICPTNTPQLSMDPQLLRYIHRSAVSNACKYGAFGGTVNTEVHYFERKGEFEMDVVNQPGPFNEELMLMGGYACDAVFQQGTRLPMHKGSDDDNGQAISSGDGAWVMQKCAKTMGGLCSIRFDPHQTVFSFRCRVEPYNLPWKANEEFQVPPGTWGIAFDDTSIQRKLMKRILQHMGVDESRIVVRGKAVSDIQDLDKLILQCLESHTSGKVLVLMDENLDYECDGISRRLSGSWHSNEVLQKLTSDQLARVLILVRSANDSDSDIALYEQRTHGFFPKAASMTKAKVREVLAPKWKERFSKFGIRSETDITDVSSLEFEGDVPKKIDWPSERHSASETFDTDAELLESLHKAEKVVERDLAQDWNAVWHSLHALQGDLVVGENNTALRVCASLISDLPIDAPPKDFPHRWAQVQKLMRKELEPCAFSLGSTE